jgi:ABC-type multidrug transport system fused ATPase/permease subunit
MQLQASRSGKSTLASLLLRVYPVDDGRILIDGYDVRDLAATPLSRTMYHAHH